MIRELVHLYILHLFTLLFLHQSTSIHLSNSQSLLLLLLFPFSGASFSFLISSRCEKHLFHLSFIIFCLTSFIFHLSSVIFHFQKRSKCERDCERGRPWWYPYVRIPVCPVLPALFRRWHVGCDWKGKELHTILQTTWHFLLPHRRKAGFVW